MNSLLLNRLEETGWSAAGLAKTLKEYARDNDGTLNVEGLEALALAAQEREAGGGPDDAVRLGMLALNCVKSDDMVDPDSSEQALLFMETLRWARFRFHALLRRHPEAVSLDGLQASDRKAIEGHEGAIDEERVCAGGENPEAASEYVMNSLETRSAADERFADGLAIVERSARALRLSGHHRAACLVAKAGLELQERVNVPSAPADRVMKDAATDLQLQFVAALGAVEEDDETRLVSLKWLLKSTRGKVRVGMDDFPVLNLSQRDQDEVVKRLRKSTSKSARIALLRVGKDTLDRDTYLELCRETSHAQGIVATLAEGGDFDAAFAEARTAIAADDRQWQLAKIFEGHGRIDLAVDLLMDVVEATFQSELELWLAGLLQGLGRDDEVLTLFRNRFKKRPAFPQYIAIRDRIQEEDWPAVRRDLLSELRTRRLYRPMVDIAVKECDVELLTSVSSEIDNDQAKHVKQILQTWIDNSEVARPVVEEVLAKLERRTYDHKRKVPEAVVDEAPIPERVRHKKFGDGDVVSWSGALGSRKYVIEFDDVGKKVLLARFVEAVELEVED